MMKINHLENGKVEIVTDTGVLVLTSAEKYTLYHNLKTHNDTDILIDCINEFSDWKFEDSKEEVIANTELIEQLVEDVEYENIDICDEDELYWLLERRLNELTEED